MLTEFRGKMVALAINTKLTSLLDTLVQID